MRSRARRAEGGVSADVLFRARPRRDDGLSRRERRMEAWAQLRTKVERGGHRAFSARAPVDRLVSSHPRPPSRPAGPIFIIRAGISIRR